LEIALTKFNASYGRKVQRVSPEVLKLLLNYDFRGNVRELLNVIEQAVILCKGNEIGVDLMPKEFISSTEKGKILRTRCSKAPDSSILYEVIARHKGDRAGAAQELGIDRSTLWRWVKNAEGADV
jgi:transcriptional regulator with PAS, ATPase and Fis domain